MTAMTGDVQLTESALPLTAREQNFFNAASMTPNMIGQGDSLSKNQAMTLQGAVSMPVIPTMDNMPTR